MPVKITACELAARCQVFYREIHGFFYSVEFEQHRFYVDVICISTLQRCSYDKSTIFSVNKLKQYGFSRLFPFFYFSFFHFSFYFVLVFKFMSKSYLLNFLDMKVIPNCLLFSERESRRSPGKSLLRFAAGAGGSRFDIFSLVYLFSFLSPSLGDGPI